MARGKLIVFEGGYSTGKTTQSKLFYEYLLKRGPVMAPIIAREPGGTAIGEKMREILLADTSYGSRCDLMLFNAARSLLVAEVLRPALEAGRDVVLDRFWPSSVVYQGILGDVGITNAIVACEIATNGLDADIFFWLDLPAEEMESRTRARVDGHRFHRRPAAEVREAYKCVMEDFVVQSTVCHVDLAPGKPQMTHEKIVSLYEQWMRDQAAPHNDPSDA